MFKNLRRAYVDIYRIDARFVWISIFSGIFSALVPILSLYFSQIIINQMMIEASWELLSPMIIQALVVLGLSLFLRSFLDNLYQASQGNFQQRLEFKKNEKLISMKYEHIEDAKVEQLKSNLEIVSFNSMNTLLSHGFQLSQKIQYFVSIILSIILLVPVFLVKSHSLWDSGWVIVGLLVLIAIVETIYIYLTLRTSEKVTEFQMKTFEANRLFNYLFHMLFDHEAGKEIRLYNQEPRVQEQVVEGFLNKEGVIVKIMTLMYNLEFKLIVFSYTAHLLFSWIFYILIGVKAIQGNLGVGYVVASIGALNLLISSFPELLGQLVRSLMEPQALELYYQFMDLPEEEVVGSIPIEKRLDYDYELSVKNLSFTYPGSSQEILKDISLDLEVGKSYAIVGENGCGKTTFIKLLTRLYPATKGGVYLNGIDVLKYNPVEYAKLFNVVFQDFSLFSFKLDETIAASKQSDPQRLMEVIEEVGFRERFNQLPQGFDTILSKDFDAQGVQLSGGEQQKIALARALYKDGPIFILDEPTAALDPISEFEIYKNFQSMIQGRTSILISHRLSSCRFVDEILIFDQGQIIQRGNHDELVNRDGKYQQLWNAQAKFYQEQEVDTKFLYT